MSDHLFPENEFEDEAVGRAQQGEGHYAASQFKDLMLNFNLCAAITVRGRGAATFLDLRRAKRGRVALCMWSNPQERVP